MNDSITLRPVVPSDLEALYQIQLDPEANALAAVIPRSREPFMEIWSQILSDPNTLPLAIIYNDALVGSITRFGRDGHHYIGYWIDRPYWGRGIASRAVSLFLPLVPERPLHARVASHNTASLRILQKHNFKITGRQSSPATDRFLACEECLLILE